MIKIELKHFKTLHKSGNVAYSKPSTFDKFNLPEELLEAYKKYIKDKEDYDKILKKYEII